MRALRLLVVVGVAALALAAAVALLAPQVRAVATAATATEDAIDLAPLAQRSVVLAADGSELALLHAEENRSPVELAAVSPDLVTAILAVEDQDFWNHDGVNVRGIARAFLTNVEAGSTQQGGSTITQQLVKMALLTPEQDLSRKVKEAILAVQLEDQLPKEAILEAYLNSAYFGNGAYGVQAAAEVYFGTSAAVVDVQQAALLAGIIRNPTGYDPFRFPEQAKDRRDLVVRTLGGLGVITPEQVAAFQAEPLPDHAFTPLEPPRNFVLEEVKQQLLDDERLGATPAERYDALFKGGLTITTTIDPRLQELAESAVREGLPTSGLDHVDLNGNAGRFTAALISVDPATGAIRAMNNGDDFGENQYRLATQGLRQPGSSFKPIVLASALMHGYSPNDTVNGAAPCEFTSRSPYLQETWKVDNYEGGGGGMVSMATATQRSMNCAYARLMLDLGPDEVVATAQPMFSTELRPVPSMTLGAVEVHPVDMAAAFATFANDGVYHKPFIVQQVKDRDGNVVFEGGDDGVQVFSAEVARQVNAVLQTVVSGGTGTRARLAGREVAGKTGTAQNWEDAWFVGYTPQLSTAVWMGSPLGKVSMRNVGGTRVTGGSFPAAIWKGFMDPALDGQEAVGFAAAPRAKAGKLIQLDPRIDPRGKAPPEPEASTPTTTGATPPATTPPVVPEQPSTTTTTTPPPAAGTGPPSG